MPRLHGARGKIGGRLAGRQQVLLACHCSSRIFAQVPGRTQFQVDQKNLNGGIRFKMLDVLVPIPRSTEKSRRDKQTRRTSNFVLARQHVPGQKWRHSRSRRREMPIPWSGALQTSFLPANVRLRSSNSGCSNCPLGWNQGSANLQCAEFPDPPEENR